LQHKHELESGRTTDVAEKIIGFNSTGQLVNEELKTIKTPSEKEILKASSKICTFLDMAGHEK